MLDLNGSWPYLAILLAAIIEGEVVFIMAAALVSQGHLHPAGVILFGALGATIGDQAYFYAMHGRLHRWINRSPTIEARGRSLVNRVRRHETVTIVLIRFSPGLRIALTAACAYAHVSRLKFSLLSVISSVAWAAGLLLTISWLGPAASARLGMGRGWGTALAASVLLVAFGWMARRSRPGPS